jgi:hypothetical protein
MRTAVASRMSRPHSSFPSRDGREPRSQNWLRIVDRGGGDTVVSPGIWGANRLKLGRSLAGQRSTNHPFAHGCRRMTSCSIVDDPESSRGASQTMSRPLATIDDSENARTGTAAPGPRFSRAVRSATRDSGGGRARRDATTPPELGIVNLIAHHDEQTDEQLAGHGDAGLGATAAMNQGAVTTVQVIIRAGRERAA